MYLCILWTDIHFKDDLLVGESAPFKSTNVLLGNPMTSAAPSPSNKPKKKFTSESFSENDVQRRITLKVQTMPRYNLPSKYKSAIQRI